MTSAGIISKEEGEYRERRARFRSNAACFNVKRRKNIKTKKLRQQFCQVLSNTDLFEL
jgi:hypothetical protein